MYLRTLFSIFFVFASIVVGFVAPSAFAASPEGLEINPAIFEDKVDPGETRNFTLKVKNVSEVEKTFYVHTKDIKGIDEGGRPEFANEGEPTPFDLSSWITVSEGAITIPAGGTGVVQFSVRVPQEATPGSHFGGIFLDSVPPRLRTTGAAVGLSVGSLINLQIAGDIVENARFRVFSTEKMIYDKLPVQFDARIENLGNTLVRPAGFIEVVNMFGKEVASLTVNDSGAGTFPMSERTYNVVWQETDFAFGRYQAVATVVYGGDIRKTLNASTSFWVLPLVPIASVLGGVLAFILVLYVGIRMYIQGKLKEMGVTGNSRSQAALYTQKYQQPLSRTMLTVFAVVVFCVLFLVGLFMMFA